jgi:aryl-alcohol dehydrogenase-like predicted oxidoreductase
MPLSLAGRPSEAEAIGVIHAVLDAGVTLLDTADCYCLDNREVGHNERLIAKALATWRGDRSAVVVATKGGSTKPSPDRWQVNGRPEHLRAACEQSLRSLGVERIELYQLHGPDPAVPFADSVGALAELRQAGKIRWVGLSNVDVAQIEVARRIVPVQSVQNLLNPLFRGALRRRWLRPSVLEHCRKHRIAFIAFSPVGGLLHHRLPRYAVLRAIGERLGASPHAVALAWVLAQGPHVLPIPGARSPAHALDSIAAAELPLTAADCAAIDRAAPPPD